MKWAFSPLITGSSKTGYTFSLSFPIPVAPCVSSRRTKDMLSQKPFTFVDLVYFFFLILRHELSVYRCLRCLLSKTSQTESGEMNEPPAYSQSDYHAEGEIPMGGYGVPVTHPGGYHPGYGDHFSNQMPSYPNSLHFMPTGLVHAFHDPGRPPSPYLQPAAAFQTPSLTTGSSSTPETRESQQLVTPNMLPMHPISQGRIIREVEDEDEDEDEEYQGGTMHMRETRGKKPGGKGTSKEDLRRYPGELDGKRKHFLQRNRVAAMKCRKKKKEWVRDLENEKQILEEDNINLHKELQELLHNANEARALLMAHAGCHDANIDKWIENEAKRYVIGTAERYDQMLALATENARAVENARAGMSDPNINNDNNNNNNNNRGGSSVINNATMIGGPSLVSALDMPSHMVPTPHHITMPPSPAFYTPSGGMHTPGCYPGPSQDPTPFFPVMDRPSTADDEPDYDGMPMSLYDR
ncbi:hypothetical protein GGS20DRAFT_529845 [Poronia punctata]|nr:hypothetical protein GGS20DRAFT_529845 [Poronia punctata]